MRFSLLSASRSRYSDAFQVPTYRELQPQLVVELRRARRYEHPLGVVILGLHAPTRDPARSNGHAPGSRMETSPAAYGLLGAYLRNTLRETDILTGVPESLAFAAFLPGIDRQGAEQALCRLREGFQGCAGFDLSGGGAAFPADGLTIEDVIESACAAWRDATQRDLAPLLETGYTHG
jgi:hypothetical protein